MQINDMAGKFITLEGIDGSGKSTQAVKLAQWLESRTGRETIHTFEPGGWPDGKNFREFILNGGNFCAMTELMMFLADRSEHVHRVILPALRRGFNVVCERWNESTMAYQAGGHELDPNHVKRIISACNFPEPDVKILLDISPETASARINSRSNHRDKFESEGLPLMRNAAEFYRLTAESQPEKFIWIKCDNMNEDDVFRALISRLEVNLWRYR